MTWLVSILSLTTNLFAFIYGARVSFKDKGVLFLQILTCAFGCFLLGDLYNVCYFLCLETHKYNFTIGNIGYIGGLLFLLSSYYGAIARISDNGTKSFFKYRLLAFLVSFINICVILFLIIITNTNLDNFLFYVSTIISTNIIYFSFKTLIIPDVKNGILESIRIYNFLIFNFCVFQNFYNILSSCNLKIAIYLKFFISIIVIMILPVADKGVKKWYT